jgi:hypothetical protein
VITRPKVTTSLRVAKTLWAIFVIVVPWLGVPVSIIARGTSMSERDREQAEARRDQFQAYVNDVVPTNGGSPMSWPSSPLEGSGRAHRRRARTQGQAPGLIRVTAAVR